MTSEPIFGVRSLRAPRLEIRPAEAEGIASGHWGIDGVATALPAEVDENFHLVATEGEFLLKVVPADEPEELTDLVTRALIHLERCDGVSAQRVVPTRGGEPIAAFRDAAGDQRRARLTTFVPGTMLRSLRIDAELRERIGSLLARLALALRDFDHPAAGRELSWDLRHAGRMRGMLEELERSERRLQLAATLEAFERETLPRLIRLPAQVVHNDLSRDNVVLAPGGGLAAIDFGDVVRTQRVNDVAVAMADHLDSAGGAFVPALDLLRGYEAVEPLSPEERALLYSLVRTRVATRIVGGEWRAERFPENRAYLARNVERLSAVLARLPERPSAADAERLDSIANGHA